jgi:peptidoglycan/LPS O-acetylase OafA/YrhL
MNDKNFNPVLHGLRGLAAMAVLLFHWNGTFHVLGDKLRSVSFLGTDWDLFFFVRLGWVGVDWFFVLSGFLLAGNLWRRELDNGTVRRFWVRRFLRIYPGVWLHIIVLVSTLYLIGRLTNFSASDLVGNLLLWFAPLPGGVTRLNSVFWTLPIELMFYLALPFLILLYRKTGIWGLLAVSLGITVIWRMGLIWMNQTGMTSLSTGLAGTTLPGTLFLFVSGIAINHFTHEFNNRHRYFLLAAAVLLYYLAFKFLLYQRDLVPHSHWSILLWDLSLVVVIATIVKLVVKPLPGLNWLGSRPLVWIGEISYGVYLWHFPILRLMPKLFPGTFTTAMDCIYALLWCLALTIALASISYYGVERPVLNWNLRRRQRLVRQSQAATV